MAKSKPVKQNPETVTGANTTGESAKKDYVLPGLNGLRGWWVMVILILHSPGLSNYVPAWVTEHVDWIQGFGRNVVQIFFVLSGFLITLLLLRERETTRRISVKNFYLRRVFRIWPLYFLVIITGFAIGPFADPDIIDAWSSQYFTPLILCFLLLPNVAIATMHMYSWLVPTWSIGVEEQFYSFWPWVIKKARYPKSIFLSFIIITPAILYFFDSVKGNYAGHPFIMQHLAQNNFYSIDYLVNAASLDCFAFGGLFAYLYFEKHTRILNVLFSAWFQVAAYLLMAALMISRYKIPIIREELLFCLFGIWIINLSCNPKTLIRLNSRAEDYLGKISYGIYLYHYMVLFGVSKLLMLAGVTGIFFNILLLIFGAGCTIFIAHLSYQYFEKWFLKQKKRFS